MCISGESVKFHLNTAVDDVCHALRHFGVFNSVVGAQNMQLYYCDYLFHTPCCVCRGTLSLSQLSHPRKCHFEAWVIRPSLAESELALPRRFHQHRELKWCSDLVSFSWCHRTDTFGMVYDEMFFCTSSLRPCAINTTVARALHPSLPLCLCHFSARRSRCRHVFSCRSWNQKNQKTF